MRTAEVRGSAKFEWKSPRAAIHEAGHAVVAAYLHVPFRSVSIRPNTKYSGGHVKLTSWGVREYTIKRGFRPQAEVRAMLHERTTNIAVMTLAARAAEEHYFAHLYEEAFSHDEQQLRETAEHLGVLEAEFAAWREGLFEKARQIVALPHITSTIKIVAGMLEAEYQLFKKGLPASEVRGMLRSVSAPGRIPSCASVSTGWLRDRRRVAR